MLHYRLNNKIYQGILNIALLGPTLVVWLIVISSCENREKFDSKNKIEPVQKVLYLMDSLGSITFQLPHTFDTLFSWVYESDCGKPCEFQIYRYQSKKLPIIRESGLVVPKILNDSVESFTIKHSRYFKFEKADTTKNSSTHRFLKSKLVSDYNMNITYDTLENIYGRQFSIFLLEDKNEKLINKKIYAQTSLRGNYITFLFEITSKDKNRNPDISEYLKILRSIKFEKGI